MDATPSADDFAVSQSIDAGEGSDVTPSDVTLDETGKIVTLTVPEVVATAQDQSVVYSVSYKGGDATAASAFTVNGFALAVNNVQVATDSNSKLTTITADVKNAEESATATISLYGYDEEGTLKDTPEITVPGVAITEGAIEKAINVVTLESADYVAVVSVGDVDAESEFTLDFAAVDAAVNAVNLANTEPKLWTALQNSLFNYADINLITQYRAVLGTGFAKNTVKEIQDQIDAVNATKADADLVAELDGAANQIELLTLLQANFSRVNSEWINNYPQAGATAYSGLGTKVAIQNKIDTDNKNQVNLLINAAKADVTTAKYTAALDSLAFVPEDAEGDTTKATMQDDLNLVEALLAVVNANNSTDLLAALKSELLPTTSAAINDDLKDHYFAAFQDVAAKSTTLISDAAVKLNIVDQGPLEQESAAVAAVNAATSKAVLLEKLQALAAISSDLDADTIIVGLADDYWTAFEGLNIEGGDIDTAAEIQTVLVDAVNGAQLTAAVDAFEALTGVLDPDDQADQATFLGNLQRLALVVNDTASFDYADVDTNIVKEYMTALKTEVEKTTNPDEWGYAGTSDATKVAIINTVVNDQNDAIVATRLGLVAAYSGDDADELLNLLKDSYIDLDNVVDANKAAYLADLALIKTEAGSSLNKLQAAVNVANDVVAVNASSNVAAMKTALVNFINASQNLTTPGVDTAYLVLSSTVKSEVALLVLNDRADATNGVFADKAAVIASLGATDAAGAIKAHADLVAGINAIAYDDDIVTVEAALTAFGYDEYDAFNYSDRLEIAEIFFNNLELVQSTKENPNYTTLSAIEDEIDGAIAEFQAH